jgi:saccharopine dehydrogenase-like NADP-dependent oxidoreductase
MSSKVLILGGGQQGRIIAKQLHNNDCHVTIADRDENIALPSGARFQKFDVSDLQGGYRKIFGNWFRSHDVVVGALPSQFGDTAVGLAAEFGVDYVDLSFTEKDLSEYDTLARHTGARIIPDCGLAPGLPNLFVGHLLSDLAPGEVLDPVKIYVGGVARDKTVPYGYVPTWSLSDLWEEYSRDGRYLKAGKIHTAHPLDLENLESLDIPGMGKMEGFTSDGLRTLLKLKNVAPDMIEKTLRWPGHMSQIKKVMEGAGGKEQAVKKFEKIFERRRDIVALRVECGSFCKDVLVEGDRSLGLSAMAKSTAYTCAAFVNFMRMQQRAGTGNDWPLLQPGVTSPELIGSEKAYYKYIIRELRNSGVLV